MCEDIQSRGPTRHASPLRRPRVLPKAPQGKEVAQRLLRNSTMHPVKRFDSADYFKDLWLADQQKEKRRAAGEATVPEDEVGAATTAAAPAAAQPKTSDCSFLDTLQAPPELTQHRTHGHHPAAALGKRPKSPDEDHDV